MSERAGDGVLRQAESEVPAGMEAEMATRLEERERSLLRGSRSWRGYAQVVAIYAIFGAVGAIPGVMGAVGVPLGLYEGTLVVMSLVSVPTTRAFQQHGPRSVPFRRWLSLEVACFFGAFMALIYASPHVLSVFWLWFIGILAINTTTDYRHVHLPIGVAAHLGLAAAYLLRGDFTSAVVATLIGGTIMATYFMIQSSQMRLVRSEVATQLLQQRLHEGERALERERLARDLHDGLGAELMALLWKAREIAELSQDSTTQEGVREIVDGTSAALDELREIVVGMREGPTAPDELLDYLRRRARRTCGDRAALVIEAVDGGPRVTKTAVPHLVRAVMEAIRNAIQHGAATHIVVRLAPHELTVEDNGSGLPDEPDTGGDGLRNLRDRARALGGQLVFDRAELGTRLRFSWAASPAMD